MVTQTDQEGTRRRAPLSRERVLRAAVILADEAGIESVTMRRLGQEVGVEAMSLYNHVANKEDLLDGMVDVVVSEIEDALGDVERPSGPEQWKPDMRETILTARRVMLRHRWAPEVIESRTNISPTLMRYFDSLVGLFLEGGFSADTAHHALHALGSRALGFTQELFEPDEAEEVDPEASALLLQQMAHQYPHLSQMMMVVAHDADSTLGWCDDQFEFEFGLDLILDGLEGLRPKA